MFKQLIIHALRVDLDDEEASARECIERMRMRLKGEMGWRIDQAGMLAALQDWFQGLALHVPFSNFEFYKLAHHYEQQGCEVTPEQSDNDVICDYAEHYWKALAEQARQLIVWLHEWEEKESSEPDFDDYTDQYDDMLDDIHEPINLCGIEYQASRALRELDPTAYRCGLIDYMDGINIKPDVTGFEEEAEELEQAADEIAEYFEEKEGGDD